MPNADHFDAVLTPPDLQSQRYVDAFNQVKEYGALTSAVRTADQTAIGLFWAYDRPGTGAPPVLFVENLIDVANQVGNSPAENARLFAMATVAQADACIAAWDAKYEIDYWRPITAIRADAAHDDDNPNTVEDPNWVYLGAPGADPNSSSDDFTPPFPAYTSGHATMGGAMFKSIELFYGTNDFAMADAAIGVDPTTGQFTLYSSEPNSGGARDYAYFTQSGLLAPGAENSPEGENGMSRIYLGIHWLFDQQDGIYLGNAVAEYVAGHYFQAVPEPSGLAAGVLALAAVARIRRRRQA
jgi:MYXO-CTERM domain-containing protein